MTTWILAVLALYFAQVYLSALMYFPVEGVRRHLGPRDVMPERGKLTTRSDRALFNMKENLPFFFVPAILSYVVIDANQVKMLLGAQIFFWGRLAFVPAYLSGIPGLRSLAYLVALAGNLLMCWALIG